MHTRVRQHQHPPAQHATRQLQGKGGAGGPHPQLKREHTLACGALRGAGQLPNAIALQAASEDEGHEVAAVLRPGLAELGAVPARGRHGAAREVARHPGKDEQRVELPGVVESVGSSAWVPAEPSSCGHDAPPLLRRGCGARRSGRRPWSPPDRRTGRQALRPESHRGSVEPLPPRRLRPAEALRHQCNAQPRGQLAPGGAHVHGALPGRRGGAMAGGGSAELARPRRRVAARGSRRRRGAAAPTPGGEPLFRRRAHK